MTEKVIEVIAKVLDLESSDLTEDSDMENLDAWDSMNHLGVVMEIESGFGIRFSPSEMADLNSVKAIAEKIAEKVMQKKVAKGA